MSQGRSVPARGAYGQKEPQIHALTFSPYNLETSQVEFGMMRVADFPENRRFSAAC
jgi:hypothetical protein